MFRQCEIVDKSPGVFNPLQCLGNPMLIDKPLPFISAFVDAVDETIRQHSPAQGMSTTQRTWLAILGLDPGIGHFMLFEVDSEAQAPAPPIPISPRTWSAASDRKSAPLPSSRQIG
jgi:hypothetical protein